MVIDAHAHIIPRISGKKSKDVTSCGEFGKVKVGVNEIQLLPPFLENSTFNIGMLVGMMDANGIDKAVLLQNPVFGIINEDISDAIQRFPNRFYGTIQVDPFCNTALDCIQKYHSPAQSTLKFEISEEWGWSGNYPGLNLVDHKFMRIWELAESLSLKVIIDPGPINNTGYQVDEINAISDGFPNVKFLLEHLGYYTSDLLGNRVAYERWLRMIRIAKKKNVYLGFSAIYALMEEDYPCPQTISLLKEAVSIAGADKIIWGSDIPVTLGKYTYSQMKDLILKNSDFLSSTDKDNILGMNALVFFK
jgi:predicted TIM-barrel fold metal-dependent hydrolase